MNNSSPTTHHLPPKTIFVVIPCFNEEESIKEVLEEIKKASETYDDTWQSVVVNDCSIDNTQIEAGKIPNTKVLNLSVNLGVGGAVQTGFIFCSQKKADYVVKLDGDGQHKPSEIELILKPLLEDKADIVIGSRFLNNSEGFKSTFFRRLGIKILEFVCKILTNEKVTDPTSGFRAYNAKALDFMKENYPSFDYPEPEEVVLAVKHNLRLVEVPVTMRERKAGRSSISFYGSFYYMIKVILSMLFIKLRK
jgi:glycosyltransferase involved in cell wall biosynthesis